MSVLGSSRFSRRRFVLAAAAASALPGVVQAGGYRAPRNRFGVPDLQGMWTNATYTPLERDKPFTSLVISPEEARRVEAIFAKVGDFTTDDPDVLGQKDSEF
jgi:hypothetical protein